MGALSVQLNELINDLAKIIVEKLVSGEIDRTEAQEISQFILEEKRKIASVDQISSFLEELRERYFLIFDEFVEEFQKKKEFEKEDQQKIEDIKNRLLKLSAD